MLMKIKTPSYIVDYKRSKSKMKDCWKLFMKCNINSCLLSKGKSSTNKE